MKLPEEAAVVLVVGAAVVHRGRVLAARRTRPEETAGGWELPGGKVDPGESVEDAVVREVGEELGCRVRVTGALEGEVPIGDRYALRVAVSELVEGEPVPREREHDAVRWLGPEELDEVAWLPADRPFLTELRELLLDGAPLDGGNVGGAVRVGHTVRRPTGPWTAAVHRLLAHLHADGVPAVPQVLGVDTRGREVLTYLEGRIVDVDSETLTDAQLAALAAWARRLHEATRGLDDTGPWRYPAAADATVVAHNDLAPYNVCFAGDRVAGVFDWDLAAPSTALRELGLLAWTGVPLFREVEPREAARRLHLLAESYGGVSARELLEAAEARVRDSAAVVRQWVRDDAPGARGMIAAGEPARTEASLLAWERRRPAIEEELR